jgi:LysM repeat protein
MTAGTEPPPSRRSHVGWRALAALVAPFALVIGLAACGDDGDSFAPPDVTIGPTSYQTLPVVVAPTTVPGAAGEAGVPGGTVAGTQNYEVRSGDALSSIAARYEVEMQAICAVNNWTDCETHLLQPGDAILIPPGAVVPSDDDEDSESSEDAAPGTNEDGEQLCPDGAVQGVYEIVDGDFPGRVASKTDFTVDQLADANADNPAWRSFIVGQELLLPCETTESTD